MIFRLLSFLFLLVFVVAIIFTALPLSLFQKESPVVHVLLKDLSLSTFVLPMEGEKIRSRLKDVVAQKDLIVRGYFADKNIYFDKEPISANAFQDSKIIDEWLLGENSFKSYLNLNITNLESAVRDAYEKWSPKGLVHVVLISDAKENNGKLVNVSELVKQKNIVLTVMPFDGKPEDVFLKELIVPDDIAINQPFEVEACIFSTRNYKKILFQLSMDKNNLIQKELELKTGKNNFSFSTILSSPGIFELTGNVIVKDTFSENNSLTIQVKTVDMKEVLVVTEDINSTIIKMLRNSKAIPPIEFPRQTSDLLKYNSIVLENIHWKKLFDAGKIDALKEYINRGGKLFVTGGMHSFGFGEYMGSALEELLPVKVNPSGLVSMIVAIDISGSMEADVRGMRKIDIAINSLLDISKSLEPNDELGVHLYNDKRVKKDLWIPLTAVKNFENIMNNNIKIIPKPTGGTFILPALQSILDVLSASEKKMRIAVLITDGETQETNFEETLLKFKQANPPINLIVIGADLSQESQLVMAGKKAFGDAWNPVNINNVGWVNLRDCFKEALNKIAAGFSDEGEFKICANQDHPISRIIQPFESPLKGIILKTSLKPNSSTLLDVDDRFPLVAHRYFGQGEIISFQSGFYQNWAGNWLSSAQGKSFQSMISSWLQQSKNNPIKIQLENVNDGYRISILSRLSSMEKLSEVQLILKDKKFNCVRNSNYTWECQLTWQEALMIKSNEPFQVLNKNSGAKEVLLGDGLFPMVVSKEIYDIYDNSMISKHFSNNDLKWRWSEGEVPRIEVKSYQSITDFKFFFFVALVSFLLAVFCRGRSS